MLGAIIGDISGSRFEANNIKTKEFKLISFEDGCCPTDDSIMTLAIAKAFVDWKNDIQPPKNFTSLKKHAIDSMRELGRKYPNAGYGRKFYNWIWSQDPKPYNSYGNGAAMRVSPCAWAANTIEEACFFATAVTGVTHNHPEAIRAANAVSSAIFLAKTRKSKEEIRNYIEEHYYEIDFTLDEIRPGYSFHVSCQKSVPQAFEAFYESTDFEDAIRNAISIGGDSDTIAAITGSIAGAYYDIPVMLKAQARSQLDRDLNNIIDDFEKIFNVSS